MASIDEIICEFPNPFETETLTPGNFWHEQPHTALTVNSIHQQEFERIERLLDWVARTHSSRTIILEGDSGSGKSYLLARLKRVLNQKAFFAYIDPWADSDYIWRHLLRCTVDSLVHIPEGKEESQLLLWLKSLSAFNSGGFAKWVLGERGLFIKNLRSTYPSGIYQANDFFGVLYDLTNPELYLLACDWLRGENLHEDDLKKIKVKKSIYTENEAKNILTNFGRIAAETQPLVICFDNLDSIPKSEQGFLDLQTLFDVNSIIHNESIKNFFIIISIIKNTWERNKEKVQPADLAEGRVNEQIRLKAIDKKQVKALWEMRLYPLHKQAKPEPASPIYPLTQEQIDINFPGKTLPRNAMIRGRDLFRSYKNGLIENIIIDGEKISMTVEPVKNEITEFKLAWQREYLKNKERIKKIKLFSAPQLINMLKLALVALEVKKVKVKFISGTYTSYSLSYQHPATQETIGIVWVEDESMNTFFAVMNACQKAVKQKECKKLYLLRNAGVGNLKLKGYKIYHSIFNSSPHSHIKPVVSSVHYLATYNSLLNSAMANELEIAGKFLTLAELQDLTRKSEVLQECSLFQKLNIVAASSRDAEKEESLDNKGENLAPVKEFLLNLVITHRFMGLMKLIDSTSPHFPTVEESQIDSLIQELCDENKISILNPKTEREKQLVRLVSDA